MTDRYSVHPQGLCETSRVGDGTRIWAFAHVLAGAEIGADCNICDHVFIENDVKLGDRVTVKSGVQVWDGVRIEDDVFIGPNATFTNDKFPRSRQWQERPTPIIVRAGASVGANATILPGVTIGPNAMVGAGAVVTSNVPANAIVVGNPARIRGYVGAEHGREVRQFGEAAALQLPGGARMISLRRADDMRGSLAALELDDGLPFKPRRFYSVFGVPSAEIRGEHAHRACHQFLICLAGSVRVLVDDGSERAEVVLDRPDHGLYVPPMTWSTQFAYLPGTTLAVLASHPYDATDYIREYADFRRERALPDGSRPDRGR